MTQFFRIFQDGKEKGRGMIQSDGVGYIQMGGNVYRIEKKSQGEAWNGNHERLPEPATEEQGRVF